MLNVGLIGFGYWGPNLARNLNQCRYTTLRAVCDFSKERLETACRFYPQAEGVRDVEAIFGNNDIDAVAIATPVRSHFELAKKALLAGKHVWLEKPLTETVAQAEELIELADRLGKTLFVDHIFIYTGSVRKMKQLIDAGEIGDLLYFDSSRINLGLFQQDVNVIWDLAPHDLSIMDYLIPRNKLAVSVTGLSGFNGDALVPKAVMGIQLENNIVAHINVSWLSPVKIRQTLIGGTAKMILYDDTHPDEKVKVYDKGVEIKRTREELYRLHVQYRVGDMYVPKLEGHEALALAVEHFADCVINAKTPLTGGPAGLEVVKVLTAASESLHLKGAPVEIVN